MADKFPADTIRPENHEQDDEAAQAQTVAEDAMHEGVHGESERVPSDNPAGIAPEDAQDVVDHMTQMERSGIIDFDAYRGERSDDDETGSLGEREDEDRTLPLSDE